MGLISNNTDPSLAEKVRVADRRLNDLLPEIDAARACGIEIDQIEQTHRLMREAVDNLRKHYFG